MIFMGEGKGPEENGAHDGEYLSNPSSPHSSTIHSRSVKTVGVGEKS
jgi:hypothetical protein